MNDDDLWVLEHSIELRQELFNYVLKHKALPDSHTLLGRAFQVLVPATCNDDMMMTTEQQDEQLQKFAAGNLDDICDLLPVRLAKRVSLGTMQLIATLEIDFDNLQIGLLWHSKEQCFVEFDFETNEPLNVFSQPLEKYKEVICDWSKSWEKLAQGDITYTLYC